MTLGGGTHQKGPGPYDEVKRTHRHTVQALMNAACVRKGRSKGAQRRPVASLERVPGWRVGAPLTMAVRRQRSRRTETQHAALGHCPLGHSYASASVDAGKSLLLTARVQ